MLVGIIHRWPAPAGVGSVSEYQVTLNTTKYGLVRWNWKWSGPQLGGGCFLYHFNPIIHPGWMDEISIHGLDGWNSSILLVSTFVVLLLLLHWSWVGVLVQCRMGYQFVLSLGWPTPPPPPPPPPSRGSHLCMYWSPIKEWIFLPLSLCPCSSSSQIMFSFCCSLLFMAGPSWGSHLMGAQIQHNTNIIAAGINECGWIKFPVGNRLGGGQ
jgi:hypothetical protein